MLNDPANSTDPAVPELFAVNKPVFRTTDTTTAAQLIIDGQFFGTGAGTVTLSSGATTRSLTVNSWATPKVTWRCRLPPWRRLAHAGPYQLKITGSNGQSTVNSLTIHVLSGNGSSGSQSPYNPTVIEVGPGKAYDPTAASHNTNAYEHAIQDALDFAASSSSNKLVVIYPARPAPSTRLARTLRTSSSTRR
ncbi:MAG: hypothetical protein R2911_01015 [Caldilineaceae bacterium]